MSLAFRSANPKTPGFRNTFDLGMFDPLGVKYRPEDACAKPAPIESKLIAKWGPFIVKVAGAGISGWDPTEIQSDNAWIAHDATNSDTRNWSEGCPDNCGGTYLLAGPRTYCATLAHLDHFVCQTGSMSPAGRLEGFGSNQRSVRWGKDRNGLPTRPL